MEVEKLLKLSTEYLSDYLRVLLATLRSPKLEFQPIEVRTESSAVTQSPDAQTVKLRLSSELLGFLLISIFVGSVLNANVPGRSPAPEFTTTMVIVIAYWILLSSLIYVICRLFIGRESFTRTVSVNLQVLAVIHVLSSLAAFIWGNIVTGLGSGEILVRLQRLTGEAATGKPIYAYFAAQFILVLIYLPLANRRGQKFRVSRSRRATSNRGLSAALSLAEAGLFYVVFLALSLTVVELNMISYRVSNVLLSQPAQDEIALLRREREELLDEQRRLLLALEESSSPARLEETAHELGMQPARAVQIEREVQSIRQGNESLHRYLERMRSNQRAIDGATRERLNMVNANEIVVPLD